MDTEWKDAHSSFYSIDPLHSETLQLVDLHWYSALYYIRINKSVDSASIDTCKPVSIIVLAVIVINDNDIN